MKTPLAKEAAVHDEQEVYLLDTEEAGYQSVFVGLNSISKGVFDPAPDVSIPKDFIRQKLMTSSDQVCSPYQ
jgi:hypothetical protein